MLASTFYFTDSCSRKSNHLVHRIALILALHFAVFSTQPIWQPLTKALFGSCGGSTCSTTAMACAAAPILPTSPSSDDEDDQTSKGCCVPFQCCFSCCCYCTQQAQFTDLELLVENSRPSETTKTLHSAYQGKHFQPPDLA